MTAYDKTNTLFASVDAENKSVINRMGSLKFFLAVVNSGSIHEAARGSHISQPALTRQIQGLENELGVDLFERTHKGMILTQEGELLLRYARRIESECREFLLELDTFLAPKRAHINLGAGFWWSNFFLPNLITSLHTTNAAQEISLHTENATLWSKLNGGEIDALLAKIPQPENRASNFTYEELLDIELRVYASPNHPLQSQQNVLAKDLLKYHWIHVKGASETAQVLSNFFSERCLPVPKIALETESFHLAQSLIKSSNYLMLLPTNQHSQTEDPQRCIINSIEPLLKYKSGLIYRTATSEKTFTLNIFRHQLNQQLAQSEAR